MARPAGGGPSVGLVLPDGAIVRAEVDGGTVGVARDPLEPADARVHGDGAGLLAFVEAGLDVSDLRRVGYETAEGIAPLPPFDLFGRPELDDLPMVPHVSLVWRLTLTGTPFGVTSLTETFVDGRRTRHVIGGDAPADVETILSLEAMLDVLSGRVTTTELLDAGEVGLLGDPVVALLLHGFLEATPLSQVARTLVSPAATAIARFSGCCADATVAPSLRALLLGVHAAGHGAVR